MPELRAGDALMKPPVHQMLHLQVGDYLRVTWRYGKKTLTAEVPSFCCRMCAQIWPADTPPELMDPCVPPCANCGEAASMHVNGRCLFGPTSYLEAPVT